MFGIEFLGATEVCKVYASISMYFFPMCNKTKIDGRKDSKVK
jgi:hypothetical protein